MTTRKRRTKWHYLLILATGFLLFACSAENKAAELYEIAAFEEVQFNVEHATQLYQEIIEKYPETETASKARKALERLLKKSVKKQISGVENQGSGETH